jgi:hypothetical protein
MIFVSYSLERALNIVLDAASDNTQVRKGMRKNAGEINSEKSCITNDEMNSQLCVTSSVGVNCSNEL